VRNQSTRALCGRECLMEPWDMWGLLQYDCVSCGPYVISRDVFDRTIPSLSAVERAMLAACTREQSIHGRYRLALYDSEPSESPGNLAIYGLDDALEQLFPASLPQRFDRVLANLCAMTDFPGQTISLSWKDDIPVIMAETLDTASFVLNELSGLGYLVLSGCNGCWHVTLRATGIERVRELESPSGRQSSVQVFVAMWFDEKTHGAYMDGIAPAIRDVGMTPLRIDTKETNNKICDEIVAEIRRSRFLVADFTGQRGGVYFEAGFAMGLGIPVIWTCHRDSVEGLHFDTRQYAHIVWSTTEELRKKLTNRVVATIPGMQRRRV
jgi:hypothetical protein